MRIVDCSQHSMEWFAVRCGRITASRMGDVIAKIGTTKKGVPRKSKYAMPANRLKYREEVVAERLTGTNQEHFVSAAMKWGSEWEPIARTEYGLATGNDPDLVGFGFHPEWDWSGASPDALVGINGGLELKCPTAMVHREYLSSKTVPIDYAAQCHWNIECFEREWWDFMSFHPQFPKGLQKVIVTVYRDEAILRELRNQVEKFHAEVEFEIAQMGAECILPPIESFLADGWQAPDTQGTVRYGDLEVPADIDAFLDSEVADLGMTP